jgi:hypothetical protein
MVLCLRLNPLILVDRALRALAAWRSPSILGILVRPRP